MAYNSPDFYVPVMPQTDIGVASQTQHGVPNEAAEAAGEPELGTQRSPIMATMGHTVANNLLDEQALLGAHGRAEMEPTDRATAGGW